MTTLHTDSKARAAIDAAIARAQKAAKTTLSAQELRAIELATLRDIAKRELAAKNAAVSLAAKAKADRERIAKLQARAKYERTQLMRDAVTVEYAAIFSGVTSGADSQAYCRESVHTMHETVSRTIAVCENKINEFLREVAANTAPATDTTATDTTATDTTATDTTATVPATDTIVVTSKGIAFAPIVKAVGGYIAQVSERFYHVIEEGFVTIFADGVAVRDTRGLMRYLSGMGA